MAPGSGSTTIRQSFKSVPKTAEQRRGVAHGIANDFSDVGSLQLKCVYGVFFTNARVDIQQSS